MLKRPLSILAALLALSAPAVARPDQAAEEAWTPTETKLRAEAAGISLPQTVAGLSLSKSGELTNGGKGIDNYAQYLSEDGAVQATLYVYLPSYADASVAAYMTDKAIMERFGAKTRRTAYANAPVAGRARSAIRAVYDDAADGTLTTAAAFVQAGRWMVKLRITGPAERRAEVLGGLDSMLASLNFDDPAGVQATAPIQPASCPLAEGADARLTGQKAEAPAELSTARDRNGTFCVRGQVKTADGNHEILQQTDVANVAIIVPVDDAGTVLTFDPARTGPGYQLSIHSVGQTQIYGIYDRVPNSRQIAEILDGKDPQTARAATTADYTANGEVTIRTADAKTR